MWHTTVGTSRLTASSLPMAIVRACRRIYVLSFDSDLLFFILGDPWREATLSADGVNVQGTESQPVVVSDGFHCSDLLTRNARVDDTILDVHTQALASMKTWLADWTPTSSKRELDGTVYKRSYAIKREE